MLDDLVRSVRQALRHLRKSPGFTAIAVLSLTLGIGANTAIFSVINSVLLSASPLDEPQELVEVYKHQEDFSATPLPYPEIVDIREASEDIFEGVTASGYTFSQLDRTDGVEVVPVEMVSGNYFSVFGIQPHLGRMLAQADEDSRASVVVLDHAHWSKEHGADPEIVGTQLRVSGQPFTVVGVTPQEFTGNVRGLQPAMYLPIVLAGVVEPTEGTPRLEQRGSHWVFSKARLLPGVTLVEANARLEAVGASLKEAGHDAWQGNDYLFAMPTVDVVMNPMIDQFLVPASTLLLAVVALVLLVACTNLASFLLARAASRRREVAVRLALGASRGSLIRQLLTETVLLSLISGTLGVFLAIGSLRWLSSADLPLPLPITLDFAVDGRVLLFSLAVSLAAGLFFGLFPALQSSKPDVVTTLKDEGTGGGRKRRINLRSVLVTTQVAVSTLLLVGAGLFVRSLLATQNLDPGFGSQPTGPAEHLPAEQ